jgi:predicted DNA-binding protein (UPF0251 family)
VTQEGRRPKPTPLVSISEVLVKAGEVSGDVLKKKGGLPDGGGAVNTMGPIRVSEASAIHFDPAPSTKDLPGGIRQLTDQEFDRLLAAVLAEQQRRGRKLPVSRNISRKPQIKEVALPLTLAKLNAIRAAFKAGVAPSRIARQFGISQSDVRKALASHESKRGPSRD